MYVAEDPSGRRVALKELAFALVPNAQAIEAFEREARLLRELTHPAVPRFVASFQEGAGPKLRLYLAQEFVEGETLLARIARGPLTEGDCRKIAREVLDVLDALHRRSPKILHRDIKPANLIVREDGTIALVDFGAARELLRDVTHGATFVGTFGYMPFEQMGGTVDERSDLYALGATLLHCLTGVPPDDLMGESLTAAFDRSATTPSPGFRAMLARLLVRERDYRCRSAAEALALLDSDRALQNAPAFSRILAPQTRYQTIVNSALGLSLLTGAGWVFSPERLG